MCTKFKIFVHNIKRRQMGKPDLRLLKTNDRKPDEKPINTKARYRSACSIKHKRKKENKGNVKGAQKQQCRKNA